MESLQFMSLINWLESEINFPKFYWSARDSSFEVAGTGISEESNYPKSGYFGFLRFNDSNTTTDSSWEGFGKSRFIKPKKIHFGTRKYTQLNTTINSNTLLKVNNVYRENLLNSDIDVYLNDLWDKKISTIIGLIKKKAIKKVVLANKFKIEKICTINPIEILKQLQIKFPTAYLFLFQISDHLAFLGASPERLFKRNGNYILTEALAGTKPLDIHLNDFIKDKKEIFEHEIVVKNILQSLKNISYKNKIVYSRRIIKLPYVQHMKTQLSGTLLPAITDADILRALHPTSAICGWPKKNAFNVIKNMESFDRGLYSGIIGYVANKKSEFSVSIRSALINNNTMTIFGGAGIVKSSIAEKEWQEIKNKTEFWKDLI